MCRGWTYVSLPTSLSFVWVIILKIYICLFKYVGEKGKPPSNLLKENQIFGEVPYQYRYSFKNRKFSKLYFCEII